ncbi:MAG TPA: ATP-binding cassette domain-containing protein [Candidatus Saccharimonadales bacterium]|nr:ATP-binding cassette domain-containing protein [Candidatus Saccharimonadales bacterium]
MGRRKDLEAEGAAGPEPAAAVPTEAAGEAEPAAMAAPAAAPAPEPVAALERVSRLYRSGRGVEEVSLAVRAREVLGLLGPPGSGRTTLLRLLAGLLEPGTGQVVLFGQAGRAGRRAQRRRIGLQLERDAHFPALSGFHNAYFIGSLHGAPRERLLPRVDGLFDELELRGERDLPVATLDADARRRLSLLEALAHGPELVLLDQPGRGLGYNSEIAARHVIAAAAARGAAVVLATSSAAEAEALCHRVAVLHRGRVLALGTREELMAELEGHVQVTCELALPVEPEPFRALPGVVQVAADHTTLALLLRRGGSALDAVVAQVARAGGELVNLHVGRPNLGDVYLRHAGLRLEADA